MGCGASTTVPCATVKTVPYERLKRAAGDESDDELYGPPKVYLSDIQGAGGITDVQSFLVIIVLYILSFKTLVSLFGQLCDLCTSHL